MEKIQALQEILAGMKVYDLSPLLENGMARWPTHPPLVINQTVTHAHDGYYCQTLFMPEHIGTHVDAPAHIHADMMDKTIETIRPELLLAPAVNYPLYRLELGAGDLATAEDLLSLERDMGTGVGKEEIAILNFGWEKRAINGRGWEDYAYNSPGLDESAVKLLYERGIRAAGSDTMAFDTATVDSVQKCSHAHDKYFLPNGVLIIEGLVNLEKLPVRSFFAALPLKIKNGSGSPIRCIAFSEE